MYYHDPVKALRILARHVRPGGLIVLQEADLEACGSLPPTPVLSQCLEWLKATFRVTKAKLRMGLELHSAFLQAGLPAPGLRLDGLISGSDNSPLYAAIANLVKALLPAMEKFGIATAEQVGISDLESRLRDEIVASGRIAFFPTLIGAWARTRA